MGAKEELLNKIAGIESGEVAKGSTFERKLDDAAIYFLVGLTGTGFVSAATLAEHFKVAQRTIHTTWRTSRRYYREPKEKRAEMGPAAFAEKYVDAALLDKLLQRDRDRSMVRRLYEKPAFRNADSAAGNHNFRYRASVIEFQIAWLEAGDVKTYAGEPLPEPSLQGWWWRAIGTSVFAHAVETGDDWVGPSPTSREAFQNAQGELKRQYDVSTDHGTNV